MSCKRCGLNHSGMVRCEVAKHLVVTPVSDLVVTPSVVVTRHGKYRDVIKRKWYLRLYAQAERALKSGRAMEFNYKEQ